jgi:hypothetical protein
MSPNSLLEREAAAFARYLRLNLFRRSINDSNHEISQTSSLIGRILSKGCGATDGIFVSLHEVEISTLSNNAKVAGSGTFGSACDVAI